MSPLILLDNDVKLPEDMSLALPQTPYSHPPRQSQLLCARPLPPGRRRLAASLLEQLEHKSIWDA